MLNWFKKYPLFKELLYWTIVFILLLTMIIYVIKKEKIEITIKFGETFNNRQFVISGD